MGLANRSPSRPSPMPAPTTLLATAERLCRQRNVRLTKRRRDVLKIVVRHHSAIGAYEILDRLNDNDQLSPITVYRALEFLVTQGLVHRIGSLNAFVACRQPANPHGAQFLICRACGAIEEWIDPAVDAAIAASAMAASFAMSSSAIEIAGDCRDCCQRNDA